METQNALFLALMVAFGVLHVASTQGRVCTPWRIVSYTRTLIVGPDDKTFMEYSVLFAQGNYYSAASILANASLTWDQLAAFAPITCAGGSS